MSATTTQTVRITAARRYRRYGATGVTVYYLPPVVQHTADGRTVRYEPGGYSSKSNTLALVRRLYAERPLLVEWPDGTTTTVKGVTA